MEIRIQEDAVDRAPNAPDGLPTDGPDGRFAGCGIGVMDADRSAAGDLETLLVPAGCSVRVYGKLENLLDAERPDPPSCLFLGAARNGGRSGLQTLAELRRRNWKVPVVVTAETWNVELVVDAMRAGADGFVPRPFDPRQLRDALCQALARERNTGRKGIPMGGPSLLLASLNERELEVVRYVVGGLLNKEIAERMGLALITVKVYRGRAMRKLGAGNAAELARIATLEGLVSELDGPAGSEPRLKPH